MNIFDAYKQNFKSTMQEEYTLEEYLELCKNDKRVYETAPERMLRAIGEPKIIDTGEDPRLSRIFMNKKMKFYSAFEEFYGMEESIEKIVSYFKHAAQGLEESKQILYLLGPVGGGKSSLAEKLKSLMEKNPIYIIKDSPVYESPLWLFNIEEHGEYLKNNYGIEKRFLKNIISPWAAKKLNEYRGDISKFKVVKVWPSQLNQIAVTKTEPGDENNQDISSLVGKVDIRKLEMFSQNDPDAYNYGGGLNVTTQGLLEFVEMFKAPIKMLHPLLTATQEGNYNGTETFGAIPYAGIIVAHSNESEWNSFKSDKKNEAFLDRVYLVKVPYCLRIDEEVKIYKKLLNNSDLSNSPIAPGTLEMLAKFIILSRIKEPDNSNIYSKLKIYNGENLKDEDPNAKSLQEYKDDAGVDEGMIGLSTRFAYKILSKTFNFDHEELSANPVHLMYNLEEQIMQEQFDKDKEEDYLDHLKDHLFTEYSKLISEELQKAFIESYHDYGQNIFDNYIKYADAWIEDIDYRDQNTGQMFDKDQLDKELAKIEKPAGIANPKSFRNEVTKFVLREKANKQKDVSWTEYEKLRRVIEKHMFSQTEDLLPIISFGTKKTKDEENKHKQFIDRMIERGYTEKMVRLLVEWYIRVRKHN
jgi:serine protein kinase